MNEYQSGDFCKHAKCYWNDSRMAGDKEMCYRCGAYRFHKYLKDNGFLIVKKNTNSEGAR